MHFGSPSYGLHRSAACINNPSEFCCTKLTSPGGCKANSFTGEAYEVGCAASFYWEKTINLCKFAAICRSAIDNTWIFLYNIVSIKYILWKEPL